MRRRGFTMLIAITCLALVGVAMTLVVDLARDDARRTIAERAEAQQRQLLLAAHAFIAATPTPPAVGELPTPVDLGATLRIVAVDRPTPGHAVVTIRATFAGSTLGERASYDDGGGDGKWRFSGAEIER